MNTYSDGTRITAPFYVIRCTSCGHEGWCVIKKNICSKCGKEAICIPANEVKRESLLVKHPVAIFHHCQGG